MAYVKDKTAARLAAKFKAISEKDVATKAVAEAIAEEIETVLREAVVEVKLKLTADASSGIVAIDETLKGGIK